MPKATGNSEYCAMIIRLSRYMKKDRASYFFGKILASLEIINVLIFPFIFKKLIAIISGTVNNPNQEILLMMGLLLSILVLTPVICFGIYISQKACITGKVNLKKEAFSHIQNMDINKLGSQKIGDYITILSNDVEKCMGIFSGFGIKSVFQFIVICPVTVIILLYYSWQTAIITMLLSFLCIYISAVFNPKVNVLSQDAKKEMGNTANALIELVSGFSVVRMFACYENLRFKFTSTCKTIFAKRVKYRTLNGIVDSFLNFFQMATQPFSLIVGLILITFGKSDIATIVLVSSIAGVMSDSARGVGTFIANIQPQVVSIGRVFDLLNKPTIENRSTKNPVNLKEKTAISVQNLCFSYNGKDIVLDNFSCEIHTGETVSFIGSSGCGKSTLFRLLLEFYEPTSGEIYYFGRERKSLSKSDINSLVSYVPQDCSLFEGSVEYNISLGKLGATKDEIYNAARLAHLGDFISNQKDGLDTLVGEKGAKLSGGEKQRIAIARAFLKNAPILLLDEPTSALDMDSEKEVLLALSELMKGRTTLIISHQEQTTDQADRVINMTPPYSIDDGLGIRGYSARDEKSAIITNP